MSTLLIHHAALLVTMDAQRREIPDGAVFIRDHVIEQVGASADLPATADEVIDARGQVVIPGLVNTHHHMYQSLTRVVRPAQDCELFEWLRTLYPIWSGLTPEHAHVSTQTAMAELLLSGCTTSADHLYIYPNGVRLDDTLEAAREIGMRFHASRGSMSVGQSQGGLPPDRVVEREADILADTQRVIERWHDPARHAMQRIVVAPCSPFSVSRELMRDAALLAREEEIDAASIEGLLAVWQREDKVWLELAESDFNQPFFLSPKLASGIGEALATRLADRGQRLKGERQLVALDRATQLGLDREATAGGAG